MTRQASSALSRFLFRKGKPERLRTKQNFYPRRRGNGLRHLGLPSSFFSHLCLFLMILFLSMIALLRGLKTETRSDRHFSAWTQTAHLLSSVLNFKSSIISCSRVDLNIKKTNKKNTELSGELGVETHHAVC